MGLQRGEESVTRLCPPRSTSLKGEAACTHPAIPETPWRESEGRIL